MEGEVRLVEAGSDGGAQWYENPDLNADKAVNFKPNSPKAQSAKGRYVYKLRLHPTDRVKNQYSGYMSIDWTMTIVWSGAATSKFHSVYKGDVTAMYDPTTRTVTDGVAKGTSKTTDTYVTDGKGLPHKTSGNFVWTFATK